MNELKFGHRVIAWDSDDGNKIKGRFVSVDLAGGCAWVIDDNGGEPYYYNNVILDPDATEFVAEDIVDVSDNGVSWFRAMYHGSHNEHYVCRKETDDGYDKYTYWGHCRYPQQEQQEKRELPNWVGEVKFSELAKMWQEKGGEK